MSSILSDEERKRMFEKKKYFREHPEEAKKEYLRTHQDPVSCVILHKKSEDYTNIVTCPLLSREIKQGEDCWDIAKAAEGLYPEAFVDQKAIQKENWREICNNCPNHLE